MKKKKKSKEEMFKEGEIKNEKRVKGDEIRSKRWGRRGKVNVKRLF